MKSDVWSMLKSAAVFGGPYLCYKLGRGVTPVLAGYKITHQCNLRCLHCPYWKRTGAQQDFDGVVRTLETLRSMGVRILILEGGEPLLWRDGTKTIQDVITEARKRFAAVCMTTNGTLSWGGLSLDRVWVSLDGTPAVHDAIRGKGTFEKVLTRVERDGKGQAFVSTTMNTLNAESIPELFSILRGLVAGVTVQFHYPYDGLPDPLFIRPEARAPLVDRLIRLKREGYPVANSVRSLSEMKKDLWTCEEKLLANAEPEGKIVHGCYLKNRGEAVCSLCGFTAHNEMALAFRGRWQSIVTGLRIFFGRAW